MEVEVSKDRSGTRLSQADFSGKVKERHCFRAHGIESRLGIVH